MVFLFWLLISTGTVWVLHGWAVGAFPWFARRRRGLAIALAALVAQQTLTGWVVTRWHGHFVEGVHTAGSVAIMALAIAALPIAVLRVLSWAQRALAAPRSLSDPRPAPDGAITRRQVVEGLGGTAALGASGLVLGWGAVRGRHEFELCEVAVRIPGLPRALDGYVIAQISDIHVGTHLAERDLDSGLYLVRKARPDLVVVTGDLVDQDPSLAPYLARKLADLSPRDGVAAILGDHDYYAGADAVVAALRAAGVDPLVDEGRHVRPRDGGGFALLGVDDRGSTRYGRTGPQLEQALSMVAPDLPRILLSHQPPTVARWAGRVALQLSGHTHGGRINPGFRPADLFYPYVAGAYAVGGTTLYVNRGLGTVGPPSRVGAPPEVTRIVLVAA